MHRPPPSYEKKNYFAALRDINVVGYDCNEFGHRSYECRRNFFQPSGEISVSSFNKNIKCYHYQNYGHIAKHCKSRTAKHKKTSTMEPKIIFD